MNIIFMFVKDEFWSKIKPTNRIPITTVAWQGLAIDTGLWSFYARAYNACWSWQTLLSLNFWT